MKNKHQLLIVHGGETFRNRKDYLKYLKTKKISLEKSKNWAGQYLEDNLGRQFQIIRPEMPLKHMAHYDEWKIWFKKYIPFLKNGVILIGCSLGGIFLAKYLSENKFPKKILSVYLVCPPYFDLFDTEDLDGGFRTKSDLSLITKQAKNVYLLFSKDDPVVLISNAYAYREKLPNAKTIIYKSKDGHFRVPTFPEIIKMIKSDIKKR